MNSASTAYTTEPWWSHERMAGFQHPSCKLLAKLCPCALQWREEAFGAGTIHPPLAWAPLRQGPPGRRPAGGGPPGAARRCAAASPPCRPSSPEQRPGTSSPPPPPPRQPSPGRWPLPSEWSGKRPGVTTQADAPRPAGGVHLVGGAPGRPGRDVPAGHPEVAADDVPVPVGRDVHQRLLGGGGGAR